jgi:cytosine/adenosine deaminase-related metal-dependent hydrolase
MTEAETDAMASSGAVAGLCPVTEANLGDGTFAARRFLDAGGRFGVGSDSNVLIGVADELRQLEYSQRLLERQRNVLARANGSTGRFLFDAALEGGAAALGAGPAGIAVGDAADFVSLDADHPMLAGKRSDASLDAWIFAGAKVDCVWARGRKLVTGGRHIGRDAIAANYRAAILQLAEA